MQADGLLTGCEGLDYFRKPVAAGFPFGLSTSFDVRKAVSLK